MVHASHPDTPPHARRDLLDRQAQVVALGRGEKRGHVGLASEESLDAGLVASEEELLSEEPSRLEAALPQPRHRQEVPGQGGTVHPGGGGAPEGLQLERSVGADEERRARAHRAATERAHEDAGAERLGTGGHQRRGPGRVHLAARTASVSAS
jgi:hypothetical protein